MSALCLIHLVWAPLGVQPLERFLATYRSVPAGRPHRLLVVLNGFTGVDPAPWRHVLRQTAHDELQLPAPVQDIPAYAAAARHASEPLVCFCNSWSEPLAPGWLALLASHATRPEVGLVGASGSWESHRSNLVGELSPGGLARALRRRLGGTSSTSRAVEVARPPAARSSLPGALVRYGRALGEARAHFDRFPSPHIRTNGFMLRRELWASLQVGDIHDKFDALRFESGRAGLTGQVEARGLRALVVGRDGQGLAPADWWRSGGYRSGSQDNLLLADNRTR
ncbi:MAG: hypothetical protein JWL60_531, partial [Gemmatimonadetes bacterium]|nr:hypothetical protein [Gemmatimonadota bacterium]